MERVYSTGPLNASNGKDLLNVIRDNIAITGWVVVDDQIESSSYVVLYSEGHANARLPCYVKCRHLTTYFIVDMWIHWDSAVHVGHGCINFSTPATFHTYSIGTYCDSTTYNTITIKGNKDFIWFDILRPTTAILQSCTVMLLDNMAYDYMGEWQSETVAGTGVVVQFKDGQVEEFRLGTEYRVISPNGHIEKVVPTAKDPVNQQITLDQMHYTVSSGTIMGSFPFPWISYGQVNGSTNYSPMAATGTTDYAYSSTAIVASCQGLLVNKSMALPSYSNDWNNHNEVSLNPWTFYELGYGVWGTSSYLHYARYGNIGDTIGINQLDIGTVSSGSLSTFTDNTKSWVSGVLQGMAMIILTGDQQDVVRYITANTLDTITVDPDFSTTISGGAAYAVCEAFYERVASPGADLAVRSVY